MSQIGGVGVAARLKVVIRLNSVICEAFGQVQRRGRPNNGGTCLTLTKEQLSGARLDDEQFMNLAFEDFMMILSNNVWRLFPS